MQPVVFEFEACPGDDVANGRGHDDFARRSERHHARGDVDGDTTNIARPELDLAHVDTGADLYSERA